MQYFYKRIYTYLITLQGKEWISLFLEIGQYPISDGYQPILITPYMHIMVFHIPEMINAHGNIKQFSCQGMYVNHYVNY